MPAVLEPTDDGSDGGLQAAVRTIGAARGQRRQLRRTADQTLVPMVLVDNDRRYVFVNRAARLFFRRSLLELLGQRIDDVTPPARPDRERTVWRKLMSLGSTTGSCDLDSPGGGAIRISYHATANVLPAEHLIVFVPAGWPRDELGSVDVVPATGSPSLLSAREREVLSLVAGGAGTQEIAHELMISPATVHTHVKKALAKLGARHRAHAVAIGMQLGLIDPDWRRSASGRRILELQGLSPRDAPGQPTRRPGAPAPPGAPQ